MEYAMRRSRAAGRALPLRLTVLMMALLAVLTACGGSSGSGNSPSDNSGNPPPGDNGGGAPDPGTLSVTITGEMVVAEQTRQTLRASASPDGNYQWQWQASGVPAVILDADTDGDRYSYTAPDVASPTEFTIEASAHSVDGSAYSVNGSAHSADSGDSGRHQVTIRVLPQTEDSEQPQVSAGDDAVVAEGQPYTLIASSSARNGRSIRRLAWSQVAGPQATVDGASDQDRLTVTLPQVERAETLRFRVQVTDSGGFTASDDVEITVQNTDANSLPEVEAGNDQTVMARHQVRLQGQVSDSDGAIAAVSWQLEPPYQNIAISNGDSVNAEFTAPNSAESVTLVARLTATDNLGAQANDTVAITVNPVPNQPPHISMISAEPSSVKSGDDVQLDGVATDADGDALTYQWRQTTGPAIAIRDAASASASFAAPTVADTLSITVELEVSDGADSDIASVSIQVSPADNPDSGGFDTTCLTNPLHSDCPLYALTRLLTPDLPFCMASPFSEGCLLGDLLGPLVSGCLLNPSAQGCGDALGDVLDPSFLLEQLGQADRADTCNPAFDGSFSHYRGALHEHTAYSDGTFLTRPADVYARVESKGFGFVGSSDHSDNLGLPLTVGRGDCPPQDVLFCLLLVDKERPQDALMKWRATQTQASDASNAAFTAFRGFEWTSDRFGHANVFFSDHYINAKTGPGYAVTMALFWQWFVLPPEIGGGADGLLSFNHPGREDAIEEVLAPLGGDPGFTFNDFRYVESADYRVVGIEVFGKGSEYDSDGPDGSWLSYALDKGWHLAPVGSEDHHDTDWGDGDLPKTVLIAKSVAEEDLREAMLARRMYAVAQDYNDIYLEYSVDGEPMGSRVGRSAGVTLPVSVNVSRLNGVLTNPRIELVGPGNTVIASVNGSAMNAELVVPRVKNYAFVRVLDAGRPVAFSAPIWLLAGRPLPACEPPKSW